MFVINLALFDIIMAIEFPMFIFNSFSERLIGYDLGCTIYAALGSVSGIGGAFANAIIAFDRFKCVHFV